MFWVYPVKYSLKRITFQDFVQHMSIRFCEWVNSFMYLWKEHFFPKKVSCYIVYCYFILGQALLLLIVFIMHIFISIQKRYSISCECQIL